MKYHNGKDTLPLYNSTKSVNSGGGSGSGSINSINNNISSINIGDDDSKTRSKQLAGSTAITPKEISILGFDLSKFSAQTQFIICCCGVFFLYILYGYFQELIFSLDGFKPYGWFLTLIQFGYYTIFGYFESCIQNAGSGGGNNSNQRKIPMRTYGFLAFLTLGTMGLSNSSLGYLNYPTQVIFKCCKLVPVLIGSILIQKKSHGPLDFLAAIAMCIGLATFTLVDSTVSPNFNVVGVVMISTALLFDAVIGNVQEKAMREYRANNVEVVLYSYGIGFVYLLVILTLCGDLLPSVRFCATYPIQTYGYAFLFSLSGYLGIQFVLTLVRTCGATLAVTVTTARKAVTIALSFVFFSKPFSVQYIWAGLLVVLGIYLNVLSKRNKLSTKELFIKFGHLFKFPNKFRMIFEQHRKDALFEV